GVGATNHCAHGKHEKSNELMLDWKPFDYLTSRHGEGDKMYFTNTLWLSPLPDGRGTRLRVTIRGTLGNMPRWISRPAWRLMMKQYGYQKSFEKLAAILRGEAASKAPQAALARASA